MNRALPLLIFLAAAPALAFAGDEPAETRPPGLLVPAYFYPGGRNAATWDRLIKAAETAEIVAIVNPASGPGRRVDPTYTATFTRAKEAGIRLVGYVSTDYASRPLDDVKADLDRWLEFYPMLDGVFYDEQSSGPDKLDHYGALYDYARQDKGLAIVVTNPGTRCDEGYLARPAADIVCLFENSRGADALRRLPDYVSKYDPNRIYTLHYKVADTEGMLACLREAEARGVGWTYVTDDDLPNPWDTLPPYWDEQAASTRPKARP